MSQEQRRPDSCTVPLPAPPGGLTRRDFVGLAAGASLVLGFYLPVRKTSAATGGGDYAPNAFIRIDRQGEVTLIMPQVEMGQGVYTSLSMILAGALYYAFTWVGVV